MLSSYSGSRYSPSVEPVAGRGEVPDDVALGMYRSMVLSRTMEERLKEAYSNLEFRGELHLSLGHEAVACGVVAAASPCFVFSHHRSHALAVAKGVDLKPLVAEIFGKSTGLCKGKGGHMHLADVSKGFVISSIVGASVPIAAGHAYASKLLSSKTHTVAFTGDGALHQGAVMEAFNLASIWSLPLLVVVENNQLAFSTPASAHSSVSPLSVGARGFGMESYTIDGVDANAVYLFCRDILDKVSAEPKPVLVEFMLPRLSGHVEVVDFEEYLSAESKSERVEKDPLLVTKRVLLEGGVLSIDQDAELHEQAARQVDEAFRFASDSPMPEVEEAYTDVW